MARHTFLGATLAVSAMVALSACSSPEAEETSTAADETPAAEPIVAAADASLLPYAFLGDDGETWEGINVDLAAALSEELGREIVFENASFDAIIPGLASGRYDVALTGMFDTIARQETVDFVDFLGAKNDFLVPIDGPEVADMSGLCGMSVGIPGGALEADMLADASAVCVENGDEPIGINEYADLDAVILALTSGRIEITPNDSAANAYIRAQNEDTLKVTGSYLTEGYFAAGFPKESELRDEFFDAFSAIIEDGTYDAILTEWGIADRGLDAPIINGSPF